MGGKQEKVFAVEVASVEILKAKLHLEIKVK